MHGFSRTTLNVIIIICLLIISWANLSGGDDENTPLEPLHLPPLADAGWQHWLPAEGVPVRLRAGGTIDGGTLVLKTAARSEHIHLPNAGWHEVLQTELSALPLEEAAVILVSGPWPQHEQRAMAALLIRSLRLQPLPASVEDWPDCVRAHPAGALWLAQQAGLDWQTLTVLPQQLQQFRPRLPERDVWAEWRLEQSRQLRRAWQDEQTQIDIQADLAYHRLPDGAYQTLYLALADAQKTEVSDALACLVPSSH